MPLAATSPMVLALCLRSLQVRAYSVGRANRSASEKSFACSSTISIRHASLAKVRCERCAEWATAYSKNTVSAADVWQKMHAEKVTGLSFFFFS